MKCQDSYTTLHKDKLYVCLVFFQTTYQAIIHHNKVLQNQ